MPPVTRNPATGQTVYTDEQLAFLRAVIRARCLLGRQPTEREGYRLLRSMGYRKVEAERPPRR